MKNTEFYTPNFDDIDLDSPLTDDELDYLDIMGVDGLIQSSTRHVRDYPRMKNY